MSSSENPGSGWKSRISAAAVALSLLAGCQAQPLYGTMSGQKQSVSVSVADSRVEQTVRNELVLGFGGEQPDGAYRLDLTVSSTVAGVLPGGVDNEFSAARATVTAKYVLENVATGETVKSGSRFADAQLDLPSQHFAQVRAKREAEDRAAHAVAVLVRADVASALAR
ncbi:putative secreted (periplasmic) protein [Hoeflea sp. IMCC20628]|nr:putative secreted (periplasmic) protein [Hoeflea sp. IMCC20628]